jgi:hypothetical protein
MRISDLFPLAPLSGDANAASPPSDDDGSASADFLALFSQMTGSLEIPRADGRAPSLNNQFTAPEPLPALPADLDPAQVAQEADGKGQPAALANVHSQKNHDVSGPLTEPEEKPLSDPQVAGLPLLVVTQLPGTGATDQDATSEPAAVGEATAIRSGAAVVVPPDEPGEQSAGPGGFRNSAFMEMDPTGTNPSPGPSMPSADTVRERGPRQLPLANLRANDEPVKITGTNTRTTWLVNESRIGPSQPPLPLGNVSVAQEMNPATGAADESISAQYGAPIRTGMPQSSGFATVGLSATDQISPGIQPQMMALASSAAPRSPEVGINANCEDVPNGRDPESPVWEVKVDAVSMLPTAQVRQVKEDEGAARAEVGDSEETGCPASSVNKEGVKPGERREVLQGKNQVPQAAPAVETSEVPGRAEVPDAKPSFAQFLQSKVIDKPPAETDRTVKAGSIDVRDGAHEVLPGMSPATEPKSILPPSQTQAAATRPGEFVYQLAERIQSQLRAGEGEVRIRLKPENLGNLEIKAEAGADGIVAKIATESSTVKQYLESNLHTLQQSLQEQGLKVNRIDVVFQEALDPRNSSNQQQQSGHPGNGQTAPDSGNFTGRSRSASSFPDGEIIVDPWIATALGPNSTFHTVA